MRGISQDCFKFCDELKLKYEEIVSEPFEVYTAKKMFMAGTPFCMLPVTTLNFLSIESGQKVQYLESNFNLGIKTLD